MASSTTSPSPSNERHRQSFPLMYLSTINVSNFVSSKLSGGRKSNNYSSWKEQMLCLIESQDLLHFIIGGTDGQTNSEDCTNIRRMDRLVKGWILGSLGEDVLKYVANFATARAVWVELEKIFSRPGCMDVHPTREQQALAKEWHDYLPLYRAVQNGELNKAREILDQQDPTINALGAGLNPNLETALHIAIGTGKAFDFVKTLVEKMPNGLLGLKDKFGCTALHVAALTGNMEVAKILVGRRSDLLYLTNGADEFPVHTAAISANRKTLEYLISVTKDDVSPSPYIGETGLKLLCNVIDAGIPDVALSLARKYTDLATLKLEDGTSALKRIALKETAFFRERRFTLRARLNSGRNKPMKGKVFAKRSHEQSLNLVKCLCKNMESLDYWKASAIYEDAILTAARSGVHEVIQEIIDTFPAAIYTRDMYTKQSIFHVAAENNTSKVFDLIYQTNTIKYHQILDMADSYGNNILHLAAKLAPPHILNHFSGPVSQMRHEINWFEEIEKFLHPCLREEANDVGKTPRMVFTEEHAALKAGGAKWMKDTANASSIVAALVATITFAAAITVPGGNDGNNGFPVFSKKSAFMAFTGLNVISFFTSICSLFISLSIIASPYEEDDFRIFLPRMLNANLFCVFTSVASMLGAFIGITCLLVGQKKLWVLAPMLVLAYYPVSAFRILAASTFWNAVAFRVPRKAIIKASLLVFRSIRALVLRGVPNAVRRVNDHFIGPERERRGNRAI